MSPEFTPPTPSEKSFITPELLPECVDLYRKINTQINEWFRDATSLHPGMKNRSMADIINSDWGVPAQEHSPRNDLSEHTASDEDKELHEDRLERMKKIVQYTDNEELDVLEPSAEFIAYYIARLREFMTSDPKYANYIVALDRMTRLLKLRELLEERFGYTEHDNDLIGRIIAKLDTDANEGNKV